MNTIDEIFALDSRIVTVRVYQDGWVPRAYRWRAPGRMLVYTRGAAAPIERTYDRKRACGRGPGWVAFSERGGRLASG